METRTRDERIRDSALLLLVLGREATTEVFRSLGPKEVQDIGAAMSKLQNIQKEEVKEVLNRFRSDTGNSTSLGVGSEDAIRQSLVDALGEEKAEAIIDKILLSSNTKGLETLRWIGTRSVAEMIKNEHPQIIALVLDYLGGQEAAEVLQELPARFRGDIIMRIASLSTIHPNAMIELNQILESQLSGNATVKSKVAGGLKAAADILNFIDKKNEERIMAQMNRLDADLSEKVKELMFVFEDLIALEDRAIQTLIKEIDPKSLTHALKGASDAATDKFLGNMSKRAAAGLRDDLDMAGGVRMTEVEEAQKNILAIVRRLADEGQIYLGKE